MKTSRKGNQTSKGSHGVRPSRTARATSDPLERRTLLATLPGAISGTALSDAAVGFPARAIVGVRVYADLNRDGSWTSDVEPGTLTNASGNWQLSGLPLTSIPIRWDLDDPSLLPVSPSKSSPLNVRLRSTQPVVTQVRLRAYPYGAGNSSIVYGQAWNDYDYDGYYISPTSTFSDPKQFVGRIYLDLNRNDMRDVDEPVSNAGKTDFNFSGLPAGIYDVRVEYDATKFVPVSQASVEIAVSTTPDVSSGLVNMPFKPVGYPIGDSAISATLFQDFNGDGTFDAPETSMDSPFTAVLDLNRNGIWDAGDRSQVAGSRSGYHFRFENLAPGDYQILARPQLETGLVGFPARQEPLQVTLAPGQARRDLRIGIYAGTRGPGQASITGAVSFDQNYDGLPDQSSAALTVAELSRIVYADQNANGVRDAAEPWTRAGRNSRFVLPGLTPGTTYALRLELPAGYVAQGNPATGVVTTITAVDGSAVDVGTLLVSPLATGSGVVLGTVYNDKDRDGVFDYVVGNYESALSTGWVAWIDSNDDGAFNPGEPSVAATSSGRFQFTGLQPGTHVLRVGAAAGQPWTITPGTATSYELVVPQAGSVSALRNFMLYDPNVAPPAYNWIGVVTRAVGPLSANPVDWWSSYIDFNDNGQLDAGEPSAVGTNVGFSNLAPGSYVVRSRSSNGYGYVSRDSTDATNDIRVENRTVVEVNSHTPAVINLYTFCYAGVAYGTVFRDFDQDGIRDVGDYGLENLIAYIDRNGNAYNDGGDTSVRTTSSGFFAFTGLEPAVYEVRFQNTLEYNQTYPALNEALQLTVLGPNDPPPTAPVPGTLEADPAQDPNRLGADRLDSGAVEGVVFNDLNANGLRDATEPLVASGFTVYSDNDNDSTLSAGDSQGVTRGDGAFRIDRVSPGNRRIRFAGENALWYATADFVSASVTWGQVRTGIQIGVRRLVPPRALSASVDHGSPGASVVKVAFDEKVGASLQPGNVRIALAGGGFSLPVSVSFSASGNVASFVLPASLPDGRHTLELPAGSFAEANGTPSETPASFPFNYLRGDANADGVVDFDDLLVLAASYNTTGRTFAQGDFNYDGSANFDDLLLLASRYNVRVNAPTPPPPSPVVGDPSPDGDEDDGAPRGNAGLFE